MNWKNMNGFQKFVFVASPLCAVTFVVLSVLTLTDILLWGYGCNFIFMVLFSVSQSVLYWKTQRKQGITWLVLAGLWLLLFSLEVFI